MGRAEGRRGSGDWNPLRAKRTAEAPRGVSRDMTTVVDGGVNVIRSLHDKDTAVYDRLTKLSVAVLWIR